MNKLWLVPLILLIVGFMLSPVLNTYGQDTMNSDLTSFFTDLLEKTNSDTEFSFRVSFMTPIFDGQSDIWVGLNQDTYISEIGNSYVCFAKMFSESSLTQCIPFHNIAAVMYEE